MTLRKLLTIIFVMIVAVMVFLAVFTMGTFYQDYKDTPMINELTEGLHECQTNSNGLANDNLTKDNTIQELEKEVESLKEQLKKN